ncbi:hypothetical protein DYB38_009929 [Aphanomyces astaci]|uniref:Protein kinase domain-containing protein n=1 Tax=Aphanomyces astaci TaxID=112090 RepID=A0A397D238_APHAT|nr:hypothetical protein DYB38_009929 [Aphanomyces astaci]
MLKWSESSDYVRRYRALESDGAAAPSTWSMYPSALPRVATSRLTMYNLTITDLSSFAVQALAWDAGLVAINRSGVFAWTQVYVKRQSDSMADIAATFDSFVTSPSQTTRECVGGPNGKFLRQERTDYSTFSAKVTQCAVELVSDVPDGASAMFAQDALSSTAVPVLLLRRHVGPNINETNMAIHTSPNFGRWPWGECPPPSQPSGLIIPCDFDLKGVYLPVPSPAMNVWLNDISTLKQSMASTTTHTPSSSIANTPSTLSPTPATRPIEDSDATNRSAAMLTPVVAYIGGALGLLALLLLLWCCRRRHRRAHPPLLYFEPFVELHATPKGLHAPARPSSARPAYSFRCAPPSAHPFPALDASNLVLHLNPSKRLDFDTIERVEVLACASLTSMYFGYYCDRPVAIKGFATSKLHEINQRHLDAFTDQIRLMASFNHPNIVALVGFAWHNHPQSLVAVTEFVSQGNLLEFLVAHPGLEWTKKARLALHIARALQYLHVMLCPSVIHRDLTTKHVLISWPYAKLSGFSVSRHTHEEDSADTMTAGVGSGMYMAPEVLCESGQYSVAADMYSFGCVLVELDTQTPLFATANSTSVLLELLNGTRKPQVSSDCPDAIRYLAVQCLEADPSLRPSAFDVARALEAFIQQP